MADFDLTFAPGVAEPFVAPDEPPKKLTDPSQAAQLKPGEKFLFPDGKPGQRPFVGPAIDTAPLGSSYQGPDKSVGEIAPLDIGAQTLFSMASDPDRQRQILTSVYGAGDVKQTPDGGWLVKQGKKWLRPGRGIVGPASGFLAANAAPAVGASTLASIGGGVGAETGPGALVTGALGAGTGMVAGEAFNDMLLSMMGFKSSPGDERGRMDKAALYGVGGDLGGRAVGRVAQAFPAVGRFVSGMKDAVSENGGALVPAGLRKLFGTDPAALQKARDLAQGGNGLPGVITAPSSIHHDIPMLKLIVEQFDALFRKSPIIASRDKYYEAAAKKLGDMLGIERETPFLSQQRAVDLVAPGTAAQAHMSDQLTAAHAQLDRAVESRQALILNNISGTSSEMDSRISILQAASDHLQKEASRAADMALGDVQKTADAALAAAKAGSHPGDLWARSGEQLNQVQMAIEGVAGKGYASGHAAAGQTPLNTAPVVGATRQLLDTLPEGFENQFPGVTRQLEAISKPHGTGVMAPDGTEIMRVPDVTLEQAHNLRTLLRSKIDWTKPNSDAVDHQAKELARAVDGWIHDAAQPGQVKAGVALLDRWDDYYAKNMSRFHQQAVQTIVQKMKEGFMDDAPALAKLVLDPDSTMNRENIRKLLGPTLWKAVQGADAKAVMQASVDATGQIDAKRLVTLVQQKLRSGVWQGSDIGEGAVKAAQKLGLVRGAIPLKALPGEDIAQTLQRAVSLADEATALAKANPIGMLEQEAKRLAEEQTRGHRDINQAIQQGPLGFLVQPTTGAIEAATKIINSPDLFLAAAEHFGTDSPAFMLLRQSYAEMILEHGGVDKILKLPEAVQNVLFPGVAKDTAIKLAQDMDFLSGSLGRTVGGSMAATARVTNPLSELGKLGGHPAAKLLNRVPIVGPAVGRQVIGNFYKMVTWGSTHPAVLDYLAKGLTGSEAEREASARALRLIQKSVEFDPKTGKMIQTPAAKSALAQQLGVALQAVHLSRTERPEEKRRPQPARLTKPLLNPADQTLRSIQP